ncbi:MAG: hypothetical protein IK999_01355 [Ruminococcus sp.]|nr:hypothetical protein [Ruminococcus sp.]
MKRTICGIALGTAALSTALLLSSCGRTTINASDYVTINIDGFEEHGTAYAKVDVEKMMLENPSAFETKDGGSSLLGALSLEVYLEESLKGELDKKDNLKNGDTVTFKWDDIDTKALEKNYPVKFKLKDKKIKIEDLEEAKDLNVFDYVDVKFSGFDGKGTALIEYKDGMPVSNIRVILDNETATLSNGDKVTLKFSDDDNIVKENCLQDGYNITTFTKEITVSGLEHLKDVDLFDYLEVTFSGTSPNGTATIKQKDNSPVQYIEYTASKTDGLSNGDTVKLTLSGNYEESGVKPAVTEKEYTVEKLPYYIKELSQIPEDTMEKMKANDKDIFEAYVASNWDIPESFKKMTFLGNYFIKPKDGIDFSWSDDHWENKVYFVYKINWENDKGKGVYYWLSGYYDMIILEDGTCSFDLSQTNISYPNNNYYEIDDHGYVYGYPDLDTAFSKIITTKIDKYTYENTVKED